MPFSWSIGRSNRKSTRTGVTHLRAAIKMAQKAQRGYLTVVAVWTDQKRKTHQKKQKNSKHFKGEDLFCSLTLLSERTLKSLLRSDAAQKSPVSPPCWQRLLEAAGITINRHTESENMIPLQSENQVPSAGQWVSANSTGCNQWHAQG